MKTNCIFLIVLTLQCFACQSDDDTETFNGREVIDITERSQLYGAWKYESITVENAVDLNGDGIKNTNLLLEIPSCVLDDRYTINLSGTYVITDNSVCEESLQRSFYGPVGNYIVNERINNGIKQIDIAFNFREIESSFEGFDWKEIQELRDRNTPNKKYLKYRFEYRDFGIERPSNLLQSMTAVMVSDNLLQL